MQTFAVRQCENMCVTVISSVILASIRQRLVFLCLSLLLHPLCCILETYIKYLHVEDRERSVDKVSLPAGSECLGL